MQCLDKKLIQKTTDAFVEGSMPVSFFFAAKSISNSLNCPEQLVRQAIWIAMSKFQASLDTDFMIVPKKVLTCVYCGKEYPLGTRSYGDKELTDHIKTCPKHPLAEARQHIAALIRAFTNIRPEDKISEEAIKLQYLTDKQIETLLNARYFVYAT